MIQAAAIFLVGMAALAVVARLRKPPAKRPPGRIDGPSLCGRCGRMLTGRGPCSCEDRAGGG